MPGNGAAIVVLLVIAAAVLLPLIYLIVIYNRLVGLRNHINDAWAGIEVELQRRYDLIPNLVEVVKGYAAHERSILERVTALRERAAASHGSPAAQSVDESALIAGLRDLFVRVEAYPELKADRNFRELQAELVNTEDRIAATRRFYNGNVREMNTLVRSFPSGMVASMFGFAEREYFEIADERQRAVPRVTLG